MVSIGSVVGSKNGTHPKKKNWQAVAQNNKYNNNNNSKTTIQQPSEFLSIHTYTGKQNIKNEHTFPC
jgi:hypothetical protein